MFARMSLLKTLASRPRVEPEPVEIGILPICHNSRCITQTELYLPPLTEKLPARNAALTAAMRFIRLENIADEDV